MKNVLIGILAFLLLLVLIAVPNPVTAWLQRPTFPWWGWPVALVLLFGWAKLSGAYQNAKYERDATAQENVRRSQLTEEDYKTDKWQGSFNNVPTAYDANWQPTASKSFPKPPDRVPGIIEGMKERL